MKMNPERAKLPDGRECVIRSAKVRDAGLMCEHEWIVAGETDFVMQMPSETTRNRRVMAQILGFRAAEKDRITFCAFLGEALAGIATVSPYGDFERIAHRCTMSISLKREYWGSGVAQVLMERVLDFGTSMGYRSMEMSVDAANARAIALYEHFGFHRCGVVEGGLKRADGTYGDEVRMFRFLQ